MIPLKSGGFVVGLRYATGILSDRSGLLGMQRTVNDECANNGDQCLTTMATTVHSHRHEAAHLFHSGAHFAHRRRRAAPIRYLVPVRHLNPPVQSKTKCVSCVRDAQGRIVRSAAARRQFQRERPCPSTGLETGACPGYVVDHIVALKHGGQDESGNMQWQAVEQARAKDKVE